jgi:hypothetical protein
MTQNQHTPAHKYDGEQNERYDGKLHWPGAGGFPFIGDTAPSLHQREIEALPTVGQAHEYLFDLNDEGQREYYNWVRDRIRNGMFVRDHIDRQRSDAGKWPIIYQEWTQLCVMATPTQAPSAGSNGHGSSTNFSLRRPRET